MVPITAKLLEKLVTIQISGHLEVHSLPHDHQGAYHCGRSADQLFSLLQTLSLVLLVRDLQFVQHFWILGRHLTL